MESALVIAEREVWRNTLDVCLSREDRRQHLYLIGQTGTGKSTLLQNLIRQDIAAGEGCAFIDPHGDTARALVNAVPAARIDDVVLIEPSELSHPVAFNPFFHVPPDDRPLVASNLISTFKHLWRDSWGPRLEYLLYHTIAAILDAPDHLRPTVLSIPRMYVDERYRNAIVHHTQDPLTQQFWRGEFAAWPDRFLAEVVSPVQNKIGAIVATPAIRNLLGQWRPTIDLADVLDRRKILIANLAKGEIGEDKANLLGAFLISGLQSAAMRRSRQAEDARSDFYLYVDEFQNFGTDIFAAILAESRKMHLSLTIAHQFIDQVPEIIQNAIFGNVGSLVCFRVGAKDAQRLAQELGDYNAATLRSLGRGAICARLIRDGETNQAFLGHVHAAVQMSSGNVTTVRRQSRQRYARDREKVELNIRKWFSQSN